MTTILLSDALSAHGSQSNWPKNYIWLGHKDSARGLTPTELSNPYAQGHGNTDESFKYHLERRLSMDEGATWRVNLEAALAALTDETVLVVSEFGKGEAVIERMYRERTK